MGLQVITLPAGKSRWDATYVLEGQRYGFRFFNTGALLNKWYMDVYQADEPTRTVVAGIGLTVGVDLLCNYRYNGTALIPPGILYVQDGRRPLFDSSTQTWSNVPGFDPGVTGFDSGDYALLYLEST